MNPKIDNTVVVFDIRNFSTHRYYLGKPERRGAKLLTKLVTDILNDAVVILNSKNRECLNAGPAAFLNHTGDGFVLVVRGEQNPLVAMLWLSEFRNRVSARLAAYKQQVSAAFPETKTKLTPLDFGIGAHYGKVIPIEFKSFTGGLGVGVLGSAINIASRVEQCTKDHACKVLFTHSLLKRVTQFIPKPHRKDATSFWKSLGKHRLRGFDETFRLYEFKTGFHKLKSRWPRLSHSDQRRAPKET